MSQYSARRGRPKGSGIDDQSRIEQIAALIAADAQLKPTTAIKQLGITDPSTIRRLRDKYHAFATSAGAALAASPSPAPVSAPARPRVVAARSAAQPARRSRRVAAPLAVVEKGAPAEDAERTPAPVRQAEKPVEPVAAAKIAKPAAAHEPTPELRAAAAAASASASMFDMIPRGSLFELWCTIGLRTLAGIVEAQAALTRELLRSPGANAALHQQIAINNVAMTLLASAQARPAH